MPPINLISFGQAKEPTCLPPNDRLRLAHQLDDAVDAATGNAVHLKGNWEKERENRIRNIETIDKAIRGRVGEEGDSVWPLIKLVSQSATK